MTIWMPSTCVTMRQMKQWKWKGSSVKTCTQEQTVCILPLSITEIIKALEIERDRQDITYLSVGETGVVVGGGGGTGTFMGPTGVV